MIAMVCLVFVAIVVMGITYKINISPVDKSDHELIEVENYCMSKDYNNMVQQNSYYN